MSLICLSWILMGFMVMPSPGGSSNLLGDLSNQEPIGFGDGDQHVADSGWVSQVPEEFTFSHAFYHDLQNLDEPAQYLSVDEALFEAESLVQPKPFSIRRSREFDTTGNSAVLAPIGGPDVTDRATVINLAKMTSNAYVLDPSQPDWLNTSLKFNYSSSFGTDDGLRGHIFADRWNKTIIVAIKGTTVDPRERWRNKDRINDNLLFSCCCGAQRPDPYPYAPVCDCRCDTYQCNSTCLVQELGQGDRYYATALAVMFNVTQRIFPGSEVWLVGHSLGGAVASLMGHTFDFPVVTFESPPERLPAKRLALSSNKKSPTYHVGNSADPIFMGACSGWSSSCGIAGYAFESQCFTGKICEYNTVLDLGWHLSIANHRINTVITEVLEKYETVPECVAYEDCVDCYNWKFYDS